MILVPIDQDVLIPTMALVREYIEWKNEHAESLDRTMRGMDGGGVDLGPDRRKVIQDRDDATRLLDRLEEAAAAACGK